MQVIMLEDIKVKYDDAISNDELLIYMKQEKENWQQKGKDLASIEVTLDGEEVVIKSYERSPIKRIRRITGYLSTADRFNDAKKAELAARVAHL